MLFIPLINAFRYEIAVGTYLGGADIHGFQEVFDTGVVLDKLALIPDQQAYTSVRAVNKAGLISGEWKVFLLQPTVGPPISLICNLS